MNTETREVVGFVCRWTLLGLGVVIALLGVVAVVRATIDWGTHEAAIILPDGLSNRRKTMTITGHFSGITTDGRVPMVINTNVADGQTFSYSNRGRFWVPFLRVGDGPIQIVVKGVPYSRLAYARDTAVFAVVDPSETVYLLDATICLNPSWPNPPGLEAMMAEMARCGRIAIFYNGDLESYPAVRRRARARFPELPILYDTRRGKRPPLQTLMTAQWNLGRGEYYGGRGSYRRMIVVTDDEQLAAEASANGCRTWLIDDSGAEGVVSPRLRRFRSLESIRDMLQGRSAATAPTGGDQ